MIEQLVHSLRRLASSRDEPRGSTSADCESLQDIAGAYSDAFLLVLDCPQMHLGPAERAALLRLEEHLEDIGGRPTPAPAGSGADGDTPQWMRVHELAGAALRLLGHADDAGSDAASC